MDSFENRMISSLINDFKESSVNRQQRLIDKLSELTYHGLSIKRQSYESESRFRIRFYYQLLRKLPPCSEREMLQFARQLNEFDCESDEDDSGESTSTRRDRGFNRSPSFKSKANREVSFRRRFNLNRWFRPPYCREKS